MTQLFVYLSSACSSGLARGRGVYVLRRGLGGRGRPLRGPRERARRGRCRRWRCSSAGLVARPRAAMLLLRGYLVVAVLLLVVKTVQLGH